jgi:hypothetical protein
MLSWEPSEHGYWDGSVQPPNFIVLASIPSGTELGLPERVESWRCPNGAEGILVSQIGAKIVLLAQWGMVKRAGLFEGYNYGILG